MKVEHLSWIRFLLPQTPSYHHAKVEAHVFRVTKRWFRKQKITKAKWFQSEKIMITICSVTVKWCYVHLKMQWWSSIPNFAKTLVNREFALQMFPYRDQLPSANWLGLIEKPDSVRSKSPRYSYPALRPHPAGPPPSSVFAAYSCAPTLD